MSENSTMQFDVVIPTRWDLHNLHRILWCLDEQTLQPNNCILVINGLDDINSLKSDLQECLSPAFFQKIIWEVIPSSSHFFWNASHARNHGCQISDAKFIYFLDDDNYFDPQFLERSVFEYEKWAWMYQDRILYSPTIMWRQTGLVQSLWIKTYHFLLGRPEPVSFSWWKNKIVKLFRLFFPVSRYYKEFKDYIRISAIGGNSLLAKKSLFLQNPFDEVMWFVYEDLDFSYRITRTGIPLLLSRINRIYHMERDKTKLEQSFIANPKGAFQKARNRILFVRKNGTGKQRFIFALVALPFTTLLTLLFILFRGGKKRFEIAGAYMYGIKEWYATNIKIF